ncbi:hypothetical protein TSUD_52790 [Trifolium subterraneum]|uniref:Uncharacterized protein n=1 Tax=Trifolium subterraneum TaxID=3900 RepID=A0A2Z6MMJ9_TRISU|nr:hypothetical protein TSUD_52790 [Trifolium subterraneum]
MAGCIKMLLLTTNQAVISNITDLAARNMHHLKVIGELRDAERRVPCYNFIILDKSVDPSYAQTFFDYASQQLVKYVAVIGNENNDDFLGAIERWVHPVTDNTYSSTIQRIHDAGPGKEVLNLEGIPSKYDW